MMNRIAKLWPPPDLFGIGIHVIGVIVFAFGHEYELGLAKRKGHVEWTLTPPACKPRKDDFDKGTNWNWCFVGAGSNAAKPAPFSSGWINMPATEARPNFGFAFHAPGPGE